MISVQHLVKDFGARRAVDDVSFEVKEGEVLGFLGPNGAGKSTTMRMITGFVPPTAGTAVVNGHDVAIDPVEARREIGYLPENAPAYGDMTVAEFLAVHRRNARLPGRANATSASSRPGQVFPAGRAQPDDRHPVQGLPAAHLFRPGHPARSAGPDHGRAHRRAGPEPEARGAEHDHARWRGRRSSSSPPTCSRRSRPSAPA